MTDANKDNWSFEGGNADRRTDDDLACFVEAEPDMFGTDRLEDFLLTMTMVTRVQPKGPRLAPC